MLASRVAAERRGPARQDKSRPPAPAERRPAKVVLEQAETYRPTTTLASRACLRRTRSSLPAPQSVPWNCARGRTVSAYPRRRLGLSFLSRLKTYSPSVTTTTFASRSRSLDRLE